MRRFIKNVAGWIKEPDFNDPDKNMSALYLQVISLIGVFFTLVILVMYVMYENFTFIIFHVGAVLVYTLVVASVRLKRLRLASYLFLFPALGLLTLGILTAGGIHASIALVFPVILVFASLLLGRKPYLLYYALCIASIAFIIYAENRQIIPAYVPDPPKWPLFVAYAMMLTAMGVIIRLITENLQNNLRTVRQYADELSVQKSMLDRVGQAVVACRMDNTIIYWNQAAVDLYGWRAEDALGRKYSDVVPAQVTPEMLDGIRATMYGGDVWSGEIALQKKDQTWVRTLGTVSALKDESGAITGWIGVAADLTTRERIEFELRQRESILEVVADAASLFLETPDWRANINLMLERLGKTIHATHAYLFERHAGLHGERLSSIRYEWTAPGYPEDIHNPEFRNVNSFDKGFEQYGATLESGQPFLGNTSSFRPAEREFFSSQGIKAIVEVPLIVNGVWWGTIGFDDFVNEREWNAAEVDVLKIAGGILGAAIQRQEAESAVHESERVYRQAIEAADAVPYYEDYASDAYLFIGDGIYEMTGYCAAEMNPRVWVDIVEETVMLGEAAGLSVSEAAQLVRQGKLKSWQCDHKIRTPDGRVRWLTDRSIEILGDGNISYGSVGILQDITERKRTEEGLRQRESILEAMTFSAEQFLKTSDWRKNMDVVLERLGKALNASHAYLFEKHKTLEGDVVSSMRYEWTAPGFLSELDDPAFQNRAPLNTGIERLYEILDSGEPLAASPSLLTEAERNYLAEIHVKALLEMRIVVNGKQWGTIGFDDMVNAREWTTVEVDVVKVAANVLGAAIKRQMDDEALQNELMERKRTEQALAFSEKKFFQTFHTTPVWMTLEDADGYFVEINNAFVSAVGYSREELVGHRPAEFKLVPFREDNQTLQKNLEEKGTFRDLQIRVRRKSGEIATVLMSVENLYVNDARYMLTSVLDITEHKRAEQNYRDIFNNSIDGIFQSTEDGRFLSVNPAMARIYGYDSVEDMLGNVNDIGTQVYTDASKRDEVRKRLSAGERLVGYESLDCRKDGSTFWASMTAQAIRDAEGKIICYEGTVEDVTRRKKAEAEREALIVELAKKNTELEQFTYTVSHDLKSPLVTISGFLGYLEQDAASGNTERLKKDSQRIQEAVNKMQRLLTELLELSRVGRMMNPPQAIPFAKLVVEALDVVQGQLDAGRVTVHTHPNLPIVHGDKPRLIQVLQNLLDNAAKYMGDQPQPHIEIGQRGTEGRNVILYVQDNGIGIASEHHERVFGLFNKLDARGEGTGVGLALVKRIVEFHGGRVWVESEEGLGSTFLFTLPTGPEA